MTTISFDIQITDSKLNTQQNTRTFYYFSCCNKTHNNYTKQFMLLCDSERNKEYEKTRQHKKKKIIAQ